MPLRHFYTAGLVLLLPLVTFRLLYLAITAPIYRANWKERFGRYSNAPEFGRVIWLHAVSVGEVEAAVPLVRSLRLRFPDYRVVITTVTPTGASTVKLRFGEELTHYYLPYDLPFMLKAFLNQLKPAIGIIMETEIWPNLYYFCKTRDIPVVIANARISDNSFRGYRKFRSLVKQTLDGVAMVFAQSELDLKRFRDLGCEHDRVTMAGNLKYDLAVEPEMAEQAKWLKSRYYQERQIWIAASTHENEEEILLRTHKKLLSRYPDCVLIIAPRHPQRFDRVYKLCVEQGFQVSRRSEDGEIGDNNSILLVDSLGVLQIYYALADVAFIGGSLVHAGGHNMLEAINMDTVVITGPHTDNFREIREKLSRADALYVVNDEEQLKDMLIRLFDSPEQRQQIQDRGKNVLNENRGKTEFTTEIIAKYLH